MESNTTNISFFCPFDFYPNPELTLRYQIVKGAEGLTKTQARVWEQTLINQYGLSKNGGQLLNRINSIASKFWGQYGIK